MEYIPTIGLEIHVELKTKTKMFCDCPNDPDEKHPNVNICPVCLGYPGTLPVANKLSIEYVLKTGFALGCENPKISKFDRKNYFYPDLPKGYQISQYDMPLCQNGQINIGANVVRIRRIHLEEDTGRLLHVPDGKSSLIDFNRAGVPLMELVTEPDMHSAKEVKDFAQELQLIFRYIGVSDANMEKGQMRCEANISISLKSQELGTKVEIKNLNSFKAVERGVEYEIIRQTKLLEEGKEVLQETRGWDENEQKTFSQRLKESAHDYRYFPEPDLPPLDLSDKNYFDLENDGNFNVAAQGLRQPGSALKPFVYMTAFQKGYTPKTVLFDTLTEFDTRNTDDPEQSYKPTNFDGKLHGPIAMENALAQSLNIPAVK
ncbi:MAG: Asp-tRNA(Asn)/Glu-tRNA(Gln) amidotransferase subunit GatB, partial [Patescibacteria group bacterium]